MMAIVVIIFDALADIFIISARLINTLFSKADTDRCAFNVK